MSPLLCSSVLILIITKCLKCFGLKTLGLLWLQLSFRSSELPEKMPKACGT